MTSPLITSNHQHDLLTDLANRLVALGYSQFHQLPSRVQKFGQGHIQLTDGKGRWWKFNDVVHGREGGTEENCSTVVSLVSGSTKGALVGLGAGHKSHPSPLG